MYIMIMGFLFFLLSLWSLFGVIWAIKNDVPIDGLHEYTLGTILLGGPIWWLVTPFQYFIHYLGSLKIKPRLRRHAKESKN